MLRILAAAPGATGTGIDLSSADLARGRDNAAQDHYDLATLVDRVLAAGFRPEWIETATGR